MGEEEGEEEGGRESDHHHRRRPTTGAPLVSPLTGEDEREGSGGRRSSGSQNSVLSTAPHMLAHKFVEQSILSDLNLRRHKPKKAWWSLGWSSQSDMDESEPVTW
ncbi:hypothetical protein U1Q18_049490 [Sarracenia purpurea var. burkii]